MTALINDTSPVGLRLGMAIAALADLRWDDLQHADPEALAGFQLLVAGWHKTMVESRPTPNKSADLQT